MAQKTASVWMILLWAGLCGGQVLNTAFPERKTWWAKQVTPTLYTAGRLTSYQVKQLADTGFHSIISHYHYAEEAQLGEEVLPKTEDARMLAENLAGLHYDVLLTDGHLDGIEVVSRLTTLLDIAPTPVLYHCHYSNASTFYSLLYLLNQTAENPDFPNGISAEDVFTRGAAMGFDFYQPDLIEMVRAISQQEVTSPVKPPYDEEWYKEMWFLKPVYGNIYISGQLKSNYLPLLENQLDTYINLRRGATSPPGNTRTQEEVTLINIRDRTGTYTNGGRQTEQQLLNTRLDPNKTNEYIANGSNINYERRNPLEYGDDIGYNETLSRSHIEAHYSFQYFHTPLGAQYPYGISMWNAFNDTWREAAQRGKVVFQCRTGYRSAVAAVLTVGYMLNKNSSWALQRAEEMDYHFIANPSTDINNLFRDVLDSPRSSPPESTSSTTSATSSSRTSSTPDEMMNRAPHLGPLISTLAAVSMAVATLIISYAL